MLNLGNSSHVASTLTITCFVCRPPGLHQALNSQALWSQCPLDVLARCFKSQQDFVDNSAAACVSISWRDAFKGCAEQIKVQQNPANKGPLPSTYLQQFMGLHTFELESGPEWRQQDSSITPQHRLRMATLWTELIQSIQDSCCWLRLDGLRLHFFIPAALSALSQLSNLQSLYINSHPRADVSLEAIANLSQLQLLSLFKLSIEDFEGLSWLPTGITNLQLTCCRSADQPFRKGLCLLNLSLCPKVTSLNITHCCISFGEEAQVVDLHHIKVLVLEGAAAQGPHSLSLRH